MNELRALLEGMIGGEGDYFRSLVWGSDRNTFVVSLDEVEDTPCVGCLVSRDSDVDVVGSVRWRFALFFLVKRDEEATSEEWDMAQSELAKELHCFCARLRPYVLRYPTSFSNWSDHALSGYWCEMVASATSVGECVDCSKPEPDGEFVDYLQARNGASVSQNLSSYNIFILPFYYFENTEIEIKYIRTITNASTYSNGVYSIYIGASSKTNSTLDFDDLYNTWIVEKIQIANKQLTWQAVAETGETMTGAQAVNYGPAPYGGFLQIFARRTQNNFTTQRIAYVKISKDGTPVMDARAYRRAEGTPGLKDLVTGAFFAPQRNESITAVKEEEG